MTQLSKKIESLVAQGETKVYNAMAQVAGAISKGSQVVDQYSKGYQTMAINLTKGSNINLTKDVATLKQIHVGLGWDENQFQGAAFDLDASVIMVGATGKLAKDSNFVYFGNLQSPCGSVVHTGDNLTGGGEGDDEVINVDLARIPADVDRVIFAVNIYQAESRNQNFGMVRNAFIRLVNRETNEEMVRADLTEDSSGVHAMVFAELYRHNGDWKFKHVGQGFTGTQTTLGGILPAYQ